MIILALDSSTDACSVAISHHGDTIEDFRVAPQQQSTLLLPMIDQLLQQAALSLEQVDRFAYGCGPGSFTGLRIAAGVTQGLAFSVDKPVAAISTLQAMAQYCYQQQQFKEVIACIDARMNEVYCGHYQLDNGVMRSCHNDKLSIPEEMYFSTTAVGAGNAWAVYHEHIAQRPQVIVDDCYPHALAIAELACKMPAQELMMAEQVSPIYLRNKVVK